MRRSDRQITDAAELESILHRGRICHLSLVDDGKPYVVPLTYGYDSTALYFHSAPEGRKIDIIRKNPDVCFSIVARCDLVVDKKACSWSTRYSSVIGTGTARILTDPGEKKQGLTLLMSHYSEAGYDLTGPELEGVTVIKVQIDSLTGKKS